MKENITSVLFVCLGNICRSPMAEAIFQHLINNKGLKSNFIIDSAGTASYHIGKSADSRSILTAAKHGIDVTSKARQVTDEDFYNFEYIIAMDESNFNDLNSIKPADAKSKIIKMTDYAENGEKFVPDPYYGSLKDFEEMYCLLNVCCSQFSTYLNSKK